MIFSSLLNLRATLFLGENKSFRTMRCPSCGKKRAKVDLQEIRSGSLIHTAVHCRNPQCSAYDSSLFSYPPPTPPQKHKSFDGRPHNLRRR